AGGRGTLDGAAPAAAAGSAGRAGQRRGGDGGRAPRPGDEGARGGAGGGRRAARSGVRRRGAPSCSRSPRCAREGERSAARIMNRRSALIALLVAASPACTSCDTVPANALVSCEAQEVLPASVSTDILFVIDDSGSMSEEQANLAANLDAFIDTLVASPVQNNFRIGVTNTSVEEFTGGKSYTAGPSKNVPYPAGALVAIKIDT